MKIFGFHTYLAGSDRVPTKYKQTSEAGNRSLQTGANAPETATTEASRDRNAQRSRLDRLKFFMVTREKYRPTAPAAPAALPTLPPQPTLSAMISDALPYFTKAPTENIRSNVVPPPHSTEAPTESIRPDVVPPPHSTEAPTESVRSDVVPPPHSTEAPTESVRSDVVPPPQKTYRDFAVQHSPSDTVLPPRPLAFRSVASQWDPNDTVESKNFPFRNLPLEIQHRILKQVHPEDIKRLRSASKHAAGIGALALQHLNVDSPESLVSALRQFRDGRIKSLTLSGPAFSAINFHEVEWRDLMESACAGVEVFDVSKCPDISIVGMNNAVLHMPNLKEIKLPKGKAQSMLSVAFSLAGTTSAPAQAIERLLGHVKEMDMVGPNAISGRGLIFSMELLPKLTHLHLSTLDQLTDDVLADMLRAAPNLTHLHLKDCRMLTPEGMHAALSTASHLNSLELSDPLEDDAINPLSGEHLEQLLRAAPQLTHLALKSCLDITGEDLINSLRHVGGSLVSLELVDTSNVDGSHLARLLQQVPRLEALDLSTMDELADNDLVDALQHVPMLEELTMASSELTDAGLAAALQHVPALTYLNASHCSGLRRVTFPELNSLITLKMADADNLEHIALAGLPSLQHLDISDNDRLAKEALNDSLQHVRNTLVTLDISGLSLNDAQMPDLHNFVNLRQLDLSDNPSLTEVALRDLPVLDKLYVEGCSGLTDVALTAVRANQILGQRDF